MEAQTKSKAAQPISATAVTGMLQRKCDCGNHTIAGGQCGRCKKGIVQRKASNDSSSMEVPPIVHEVLRSPGRPLDESTREFFEPRFTYDFSRVRVHTDAKAAESAESVEALAYTVGRDVVFGEGQYSPGTATGRRLLTHELTHVVQQSRGGALDTSSEGPAEKAADQAASDLYKTARPIHVSSATAPGLARQKDPKARQSPTTKPADISVTEMGGQSVVAINEVPIAKGNASIEEIEFNFEYKQEGPNSKTGLTRDELRILVIFPEGKTMSLIKNAATEAALLKVAAVFKMVLAEKSKNQPGEQLIVLGGYKAVDTMTVRRSKPMPLDQSGIPQISRPTPLSNESMPPVKPQPELNVSPQAPAEAQPGEGITAMDVVHGALDVAGFIPALGAIPDGINAIIYAAEGDWVNAGISAVAMIPILGDGAKLATMAGKTVVKISEKTALRLGEEGVAKAIKEARTVNKAEKAAVEAGGEIEKKLGGKVETEAGKAAEEGVAKIEKEALEKAKKEAAEKVENEAVNKEKRIAECLALYAAYSSLPPCKGCAAMKTRAEVLTAISCLYAEIAGRERYLSKRCDYYLAESILKGSSVAERGHRIQLAQLHTQLYKCELKYADLLK